jgi:hypothetical protein
MLRHKVPEGSSLVKSGGVEEGSLGWEVESAEIGKSNHVLEISRNTKTWISLG